VAVERVTPDRLVGEALRRTGLVAHLPSLCMNLVIQTPNLRLTGVYAERNAIIAVLRREFANPEEERSIDQIVCDLGTLSRDELRQVLGPRSRKLAEADCARPIGGRARDFSANPDAGFDSSASAARS
jgi:hypothetical protein